MISRVFVKRNFVLHEWIIEVDTFHELSSKLRDC